MPLKKAPVLLKGHNLKSFNIKPVYNAEKENGEVILYVTAAADYKKNIVQGRQILCYL